MIVAMLQHNRNKWLNLILNMKDSKNFKNGTTVFQTPDTDWKTINE
jgi:hypothetical protein